MKNKFLVLTLVLLALSFMWHIQPTASGTFDSPPPTPIPTWPAVPPPTKPPATPYWPTATPTPWASGGDEAVYGFRVYLPMVYLP